MDIWNSLPTELLIQVLCNLSKHDLKSARLVCRFFEAAASPLLFDHVTFTPNSSSLHIFSRISRHTIFSKSVKEITYNGSYFDPYMSRAGYDSIVSDSRLTGGAAKNGGIAQLVANVFQAPVERLDVGNSAALGAAIIAAAIALMERGDIDVSSLISAIAPLEEGPHWFDRLHRGGEDLMKVILTPGDA